MARLLALLILRQRINTQVRRPGEPGVRRLHSDPGGEFKSYSREEFCQWKGNIHTFTDRAQHESNGLVERKIGQLNESTRAAILACDLPAYLWHEVYMAMCHTQNIVPSSALQPEPMNDEPPLWGSGLPKDKRFGEYGHVRTVVTYAHYACVVDCADAMADAWEDTASCAHADCLHGNILKC